MLRYIVIYVLLWSTFWWISTDPSNDYNTRKFRIIPIFAWYDLWLGFFWDHKKKWLYFFPIPCVGIIIKFKV